MPAWLAFLVGFSGFYMRGWGWIPGGSWLGVLVTVGVALVAFAVAITRIIPFAGFERFVVALVYAAACAGLVWAGVIVAFVVAVFVAEQNCTEAARSSGCPLG